MSGYERVDEYTPIHHTVWEKLDSQGEEIYHLKRTVTALRKKLRRERRRNEQLRKQIEPKQYYRNGKRNRNHGFNG